MDFTGERAGEGVANDVAGVEASADAAAGVRVGRGRTTLFFDAAIGGPQLVGPLGGTPAGHGAGPVLVEYTKAGDEPRELLFRVAGPGARAGEVVETTARLDLRDPASRAVAGRLLRVRYPWPPAVAGDLRAVVRHAVRHGVVERSVFRVRDRSSKLRAGVRLGVAMGVDADRVRVDRRLVEATAWTQGSRARERVDCAAP